MANTDRLLKLAGHLEAGALAHSKFKFDTFSDGPYLDNHCGTAGCAIGELPAAFPDLFRWAPLDKNAILDFNGIPFQDQIIYRGKTLPMDRAAESFLELSEREYYFLFTPSGSGLGCAATAGQVAEHLRKYCAGEVKLPTIENLPF